MAIRELSKEQVREWSLEQKDRWWREHVFRGDMPQLNLRSALTGMLLGGALSLTNLYVGIKTGWTLGVGLTSVIMAFALFKGISALRWGREMTILENNAMQSIATSAGYMTAPLVAAIPAYMLVTQQVVPMWHVFWWACCLSCMGVLFAFPLKKRYINDEQLPFPEGYAAGVVLDGLHTDDGKVGLFKAKILAGGGALAALIEVLTSARVMTSRLMTALRLNVLQLPEAWTDLLYRHVMPRIYGVSFADLTLQLDTSIVLMGTGGLMSMKAAMSMLAGAVVAFMVLAPIMIQHGVIHGGGYAEIVKWTLWAGVPCMTTASLYAFFARPGMLGTLRGVFRRRADRPADVLADVELPLWVSAVGVPIVGLALVLMAHGWFGVQYWLAILAIPLVFVFTIVAVHSTGLTSITPGSALAKLTQVTYSGLAPGNARTNLIAAEITSDVSLSASNLLMDIKPGYMLGAKPRQQAIGHVLGIFAGALVAVPCFYYFFFRGDLSLLTGKQLPLPSATVWRAVAELLTRGLSSLHPTAIWAVLIGAAVGLVTEAINVRTHGRFPFSAVPFGFAFVLPFASSLSMALGALVFWVLGRLLRPESTVRQALVGEQDTVCAGIIAGGALAGIVLKWIELLPG